ncbi:MAG: hypothetical protein ACOWWM_04875 [Desulfobacterales bacterium]
MDIKCHHSKIVVPGDLFYADIAAGYAGSIAEKLGIADRDVDDIRLCTRQVVAWAIEYSLSEKEEIFLEVACGVTADGFKVSVKDRGLPFEPTMMRGAESKDLAGIFRLKGGMDEIRFNNLGHEGKEIVLIKYSRQGRITDLYNSCELEYYEKGTPAEPDRSQGMDYIVRPMAPDEALEVSKCVYKGYGYTYPHEQIYYPAKLAELNRTHSMFSAVAASVRGDILGHCALMYDNPDAPIAEMGLGVVKPEYRAMGCFNRLTAFLIDKSRADRLKGVYVRAVALHPYSQKSAARFDLKECALLLGYIPATVDFRRVDKGLSQRVAVFLCFRRLDPTWQPKICPPARHRNMILDLYDHMQVEPIVKRPAAPKKPVFGTESRIHVDVLNSMSYVRIVIESCGPDILREISQIVNELCLKKIEVLNLYMDLSNPRTGPASEQIEKIGFFFAGVLPGGMPDGSDAIIFQYLNQVPIELEAVQAYSDMAKKLLAYVSGGESEAKSARLPGKRAL